jgi:hypothetical protein
MGTHGCLKSDNVSIVDPHFLGGLQGLFFFKYLVYFIKQKMNEAFRFKSSSLCDFIG